MISGSADKLIKIWNLAERREDYTLIGHDGWVSSVAFSIKGKFLASGSYDKSVRVWDLGQGKLEFLETCTYIPPDRKDNELLICGPCGTTIKIENLNAKFSFIAPKDPLDPYYQNKISFYNLQDGLKANEYDYISASVANLLVGKNSYSAVHLACYCGQSDLLKRLLHETCVIKADAFGKSPFYYCIKKKYQECVDILVVFMTSLLDSENGLNSPRIKNSFYAIRNDFGLLIQKSSSFLIPFLEKLLVSSDVIFAKIEPEFPYLKYSTILNPIIEEFGSTNNDAEEIPVRLQSSLFPLEFDLNSQSAMDFVKILVSSNNKNIFKTPIIQHYIELQWKSLKKWAGFYSFLVFMNFGLFLAILVLDDYKVYNLVLFTLINLILIVWEFLQIVSEKWGYFSDVYNVLDTLRILFTIAWIVLQFLEIFLIDFGYEGKELSLVVASFIVMRSFTGFRIFDNTRYYIKLIPMALKDTIYFVIIVAYTTLGFGVLFFISTDKTDTSLIWLQAFGLNFGGFGDTPELLSWEYLIFFLATIMNVVLMLNLLISILGNSYEKFQSNEIIFDYEERAELIIEGLQIRSIFYSKLPYVEGKFLHVCVSAYESLEEDSENLEGKLRYIEAKSDKDAQMLNEAFQIIKDTVKDQKENSNQEAEKIEKIITDTAGVLSKNILKNINGFVEQQISGVSEEIKEMKTNIGALENKINSIEEKLEVILNLVSK